MSDKCGSRDCSDKTQCTKKGNTLDIVETEKSYSESIVMGVAEKDGKCKCGPNCTCVDCGCGAH